MPIVRDGSNRVSEFKVEPVGSPPGPVERSRVSEARLAEIEAERRSIERAASERRARAAELVEQRRLQAETARASRARGAERSRTVRAARAAKPKEEHVPLVDGELSNARNPDAKAHNGRIIAEVLRSTSSYTEAGERLGISAHGIQQRVSRLRRDGLLPADVDQLLKARQYGQLEKMRAVRAARRNGSVSPAGLTAGEHRRAVKAAQAAQQSIEDREAGAPATDAVDPGTTGSPPAGEVATPPGPTPEPAAVTLSLTLDVAALARIMNDWQTYQITAFYDGLARVAAALR